MFKINLHEAMNSWIHAHKAQRPMDHMPDALKDHDHAPSLMNSHGAEPILRFDPHKNVGMFYISYMDDESLLSDVFLWFGNGGDLLGRGVVIPRERAEELGRDGWIKEALRIRHEDVRGDLLIVMAKQIELERLLGKANTFSGYIRDVVERLLLGKLKK